MALTTEIRAIIVANPSITGPDLAAKLSNEHVQYSRHQGKRWLKEYKLEEAIAKGEAKPSPDTNWRDAENREEWFVRVVAAVEPKFKTLGYVVPKLRIGCGWMSGGKRSKAMGEAWRSSSSADEIYNIFISPRLNTAIAAGDWVQEHETQYHEGDLTVINTVIHEIFHTVLWHKKCEVHDKAPHGKTFQKLCAEFDMNMLNKKGSTNFTPDGVEWAKKISEEVGPYPMAPITVETSAKPTQTTRQVKVFDGDDPTYFVRMTRDMIGKHGLPRTPAGKEMMIDPFSALRTKYTQEEVEGKDLAFKSDEGAWEITKKGQREANAIIDEIVNGKDVARIAA